MSTFEKFNKKYFASASIALIFVTGLFVASPVFAVDVRCWTQSACAKARTDSGATSQEAANGFYEGPDAKAACGESIRVGTKEQPAGFCLPAGKTVTQISFGGTTTFSHIGEFIQFMYKYGFQIAILLAIFVVLFAGAQWTMSRGNSEGIKSAQDRIYKAIMGLILYSISYTILNLLSPSFVNLRLPQIWMINPVHLSSEFCGGVDPATGLARLGPNDEARLMTTAEKAKKYTEIQTDSEGSGFSVSTQSAECGNTYLLDRGNGTTCEGIACPGVSKTCYQRIGDPTEKCAYANIAGRIYNSNFDATAGSDFFGAWTWKWANEPLVYYLCADGEYGQVGGKANDPDNDNPDEEKKIQQYQIFGIDQTQIDAAIKECAGGNLRGFLLTLDINENLENTADERHFIGVTKDSHRGVDIGDKGNWDASCLLKKIPDDLLIRPQELLKGIRVDVDINTITDIDEEEDRIRAYAEFDYKSCL